MCCVLVFPQCSGNWILSVLSFITEQHSENSSMCCANCIVRRLIKLSRCFWFGVLNPIACLPLQQNNQKFLRLKRLVNHIFTKNLDQVWEIVVFCCVRIQSYCVWGIAICCTVCERRGRVMLIAVNISLFVTNDEHRPFFMRVFRVRVGLLCEWQQQKASSVCLSEGLVRVKHGSRFQQSARHYLKIYKYTKSSLLSCRKKSKVNNIPTVSCVFWVCFVLLSSALFETIVG